MRVHLGHSTLCTASLCIAQAVSAERWCRAQLPRAIRQRAAAPTLRNPGLGAGCSSTHSFSSSLWLSRTACSAMKSVDVATPAAEAAPPATGAKRIFKSLLPKKKGRK